MDSTSVSTIIERIVCAGQKLGKNEQGSREELLELGRKLVMSLEIPSEFLARSFWAEPAMAAICKVGVPVKLFHHLREARTSGLTASELVQKAGIELDLLERMLRHLVAMHLISFQNGKFYGTPLSNGLAAERYQKSIDFCFDVARPAFNGFPEYFKKTGYTLPPSLTEGPFQSAHKTPLPLFLWLDSNPPHLENFDAFMSAYSDGKPIWYDQGFYPVDKCLVQGFDSSISNVLLVDVGGGRGHDILRFIKQHPSHPGKLVLQDREPVIDSIESQDDLPFSAEAHDFFTPQPIKHARTYLLRSILHDWDDEACHSILKNLKSALRPGYSRILINEIVVSQENPGLAHTSKDMMMLAHVNVKERAEAEWRAMVKKAGLKVLGIWSWPTVVESVIEVGLEEEVTTNGVNGFGKH